MDEETEKPSLYGSIGSVTKRRIHKESNEVISKCNCRHHSLGRRVLFVKSLHEEEDCHLRSVYRGRVPTGGMLAATKHKKRLEDEKAVDS
jgi:hypothetical protein